MKINLTTSLIAIVALVVTSGCASVKPLSIDMSGKDYPEINLKLDSISTIRYIPITNTDRFRNDSTIYDFASGNRSVFCTDNSILIGEGPRHLLNSQSKIWRFNNTGSFDKNAIVIDVHKPNGYYHDFDVDRRGRIYTGGSFNSYAVLDKDLNEIPRFSKRMARLDIDKKRGTSGVHLVKNKILSYDYLKCYVLKSRRNGGWVKPILTIAKSSYHHDFLYLTGYEEPSVIKVNGGFVLPQSFIDTVKFVDNRGKVHPYIINSKPGVFSEGGRTRRFWIYPTVITKNYIFFVSPVYDSNKLPRYYVYDKRLATMYQLKNDYSTPQELDLVNNKCYFKNRNLMLTPDMVNEFFSLNYLRANMDKLPPALKAEAEKLTDNDSGVLMIVEFDK